MCKLARLCQRVIILNQKHPWKDLKCFTIITRDGIGQTTVVRRSSSIAMLLVVMVMVMVCKMVMEVMVMVMVCKMVAPATLAQPVKVLYHPT